LSFQYRWARTRTKGTTVNSLFPGRFDDDGLGLCIFASLAATQEGGYQSIDYVGVTGSRTSETVEKLRAKDMVNGLLSIIWVA
jgi:hypothetical protein